MRRGMRLSLGKRLTVLLATASAGGTIAAVRNLGASGIDVRVVSSQRLSAAAWSRRVRRSYSAPPENQNRLFLDRLLAIGRTHPGAILLPTSDETAWLYTVNSAELERHFCMYQPSIETMRCILDKQLFTRAASEAGLPVLPIWDPQSADELLRLAPRLPYPVLIKPRTHVHRLRNDKGVVVHSASELIQRYQQYVGREQKRAGETPHLQNASRPILQQFATVGREGVHSVTGFIDRKGELFVTRRSTKVFLRSRPVGVGICFESLPPDPALSQAVRRLCQELGYFGVFEVEFLRFNGSWAVIDFNPRFFNQMAMDICRGMPLPLLACLDAAGEKTALRELVSKSQPDDDSVGTVFYDGFTLRAILFAQTIISRAAHDRARWRAWMKQNTVNAIDVAADWSDPMPGIVHALSEIYLGLRAFPRFLRTVRRASPVIPSVLTKAPS